MGRSAVRAEHLAELDVGRNMSAVVEDTEEEQ